MRTLIAVSQCLRERKLLKLQEISNRRVCQGSKVRHYHQLLYEMTVLEARIWMSAQRAEAIQALAPAASSGYSPYKAIQLIT